MGNEHLIGMMSEYTNRTDLSAVFMRERRRGSVVPFTRDSIMLREDESREIEVSVTKKGNVDFVIEIPGSEECMGFHLNRDEAKSLHDFLGLYLSRNQEAC